MRMLRNIHPVAASPSFLGKVFHHSHEERFHLNQLKAILLHTGLHPSKVKQGFDQAIQPLACAAKAVVVRLPTGFVLNSAISQHFTQLTKRGQWGTKFVRESRNEIGLE